MANDIVRKIIKRLNGILICDCCGKVGDSKSQHGHGWDGWQISPFPKCPSCIEQAITEAEGS